MNVSNEHYDLIIVEGISNECVLPLVAMFDVTFIYMNGVAPMPWLLNTIESPLASDHFPVQGFGFTDEMNFWKRTLNSLASLGYASITVIGLLHPWWIGLLAKY
ncbi:hypothetical protein DAPPUDRAFT_250191 [Daphnia pulex]|uniref:Uncharacterized protein n=1 Tax=Daphnia pulex TaxID=6669 RepID=E9GY32_DAPPU|nr:hypothetical protein DAPPUDRAFT_250191 [Daphnia pulex]|eukprot:EFX75630.1 hypothetical protein DAPPUDRAFT_250191 [Daphnia pulex]